MYRRGVAPTMPRPGPGRCDQAELSRGRPRDGRQPFGSQPEPAANFLKRDVLAWLCACRVELCRRLRVYKLLVAQFCQERDGHWYLSVRNGINEFMEAMTL